MNRLKISEIQVGEPLPFDCLDVNGVLLLKKGVVIANQRQLEGLIERGLYSDDTAARPAPKPPVSTAPAEKPSPFTVLALLENRLQKLFMGVLQQKPDPEFAQQIGKIVHEIQGLCASNADAALGAMHLSQKGLYTVVHPIHVALLCEIIAAAKGIAALDRIPILSAALTANIAILELQEKLHTQTEPLTDEQLSAIRMHPVLAVDKLLELGVQDDAWFTAVLHHHEKLDGTGYPGAMHGDYIPISSRIVSLADTYSAMVTPRRYRDAVIARDALRELFLKRGSEVDGELAQLFIKELGIFPPGAFVKLTSGDIAIVLRRGKQSTSPIVKCVIGPRGAPLPFPVQRDTLQKGFEIREMVPRDPELRMDPRQIWD